MRLRQRNSKRRQTINRATNIRNRIERFFDARNMADDDVKYGRMMDLWVHTSPLFDGFHNLRALLSRQYITWQNQNTRIDGSPNLIHH